MIVSKNRCVEPKISTFLSKGTNGNGHVACHESWGGASKDAFEFTFEAYTERRLRFALGRFGTRIRQIMVRIADLNGPRGGVDKQCRITVDVRPFGTVILEETDADLYRAIDRAAHRVSQSVRRELERLRS